MGCAITGPLAAVVAQVEVCSSRGNAAYMQQWKRVSFETFSALKAVDLIFFLLKVYGLKFLLCFAQVGAEGRDFLSVEVGGLVPAEGVRAEVPALFCTGRSGGSGLSQC